MRRLSRLFRPRTRVPSGPAGPPNAGRHYARVVYPPLTAGQIRFQQFSGVRRGLDPEEVRAFLYRVADEFAEVRAELARTKTENTRIKTALRQWQSRFRQGAQP